MTWTHDNKSARTDHTQPDDTIKEADARNASDQWRILPDWFVKMVHEKLCGRTDMPK